jgi:hypothetical protein
MNTAPSGSSRSCNVTRPDVATSLIGGHLRLMKADSFMPSMDPGIWISVKNDMDVWVALEDRDSFIRVTRFHDSKARFRDHFGGSHPQ